MSVIAVLSTHSNLVALCQKYGISRYQINDFIAEDTIQITNEIIPIRQTKNIMGWDSIIHQVNAILKTQFEKNNRVNILLAVVQDINGLVNSISNSMVNQLQRQYGYQGFWARLACTTISDQFQYFEKFATTDEFKGQVEYLEVTGEGHIESDTRSFGTNQIRLYVNIYFRAITVRCDLIAWQLSLPVTGPDLMRELEWNGIQNRSIY